MLTASEQGVETDQPSVLLTWHFSPLQKFHSESSLFLYTLYGPTCDAFDTLFVAELQLPELDVGDWLVFPSMGAYTTSMSSTFNGLPPATIYYAVNPWLRCPG